MSDVRAIDRLHRLALRLSKDDPDSQWFCAGLEEYRAGAPLGRTLESALGIEPRWWRVERAQRRDALLREIRRICFPGNSGRGAAKKIEASLERYAASGWHRDRTLMRPVQDDPLRLRLHALLKLKMPCGRSTIRSALLLANEMAAHLATSSGRLPSEDSATEDDLNHAASRNETHSLA